MPLFNASLRPDRIRLVGDVHGRIDLLRPVMRKATAERIGLLLLGDLVNRGPDSPGVVRLIAEAERQGLADFVPGNHDVRLARHARRHGLAPAEDTPPALRRTLTQFAAQDDGAALLQRFARLVETRPAWRRIGNYLCAHAGFDRRMLSGRPGSLDRPRDGSQMIARAIWGETRAQAGTDKPAPAYGWAEQVPPGLKVVIGHDVRACDRIVRRPTPNGGQIVHLDCGAGEGGRLATLDIPTAKPAAPGGWGRLTLADRPDQADRPGLPGDSVIVDGRDDPAAARDRARIHLADGRDVVLCADHTGRIARLAAIALVPAGHAIGWVCDAAAPDDVPEVSPLTGAAVPEPDPVRAA